MQFGYGDAVWVRADAVWVIFQSATQAVDIVPDIRFAIFSAKERINKIAFGREMDLGDIRKDLNYLNKL